ncbi:MAG: protein translocase subunit SecD [Planctomycetes bacterium]|nr:protein translocase subunit SecD [Planctomycetota bacterium]
MTRDKNTVIFITIISLLCAYLVLPIPNKPLGDSLLKNIKINPGIDLAGGAEVIYRVYDQDDPAIELSRDDTQKVAEIIRKRIDRIGLKEPVINVQGNNKIQIQIAGIDKEEWKEYKNIIESTGVLEWKEVIDPVTHESEYKAVQTDPNVTPQGMQRVENPYYSENGEGDDKYKYVLLDKSPIVTGKEVKNAYVSFGGIGKGYAVEFILGGPAVKKFAEATKRLAGKGKIAILLDGRIQSKPSVSGEIPGGSGEIVGSFTQKQAEETSIFLTTGSLPALIGRFDPATKKYIPKQPEMETVVGPTLGQDAIKKGMIACISAFILISVFIIAFYKTFGVIAVVGLVLNVIFLLTILELLGATLTLPGIAGIALTVGMAVDANILILERMREEKAKNKTIVQAYEHGHSKAMTAILDSNITTILTSMILYFFGSGTVKGFATTLFIGIITTLFSVLYCCKAFTKLYVYSKMDMELKFMRFFVNPNFNFIKYMKRGLAVSIVFVIASLFLVKLKGEESLGFDFTGGSVVTFQLVNSSDITTVREKITSIPGQNNIPKYSDAQVQIVADADESLRDVALLSKTTSRRFQIRTSNNIDELKNDLIKVFGLVTPYEELPATSVPDNYKIIRDRQAGFWIRLNFNKANFDFNKAEQLIMNQSRNLLTMDNNFVPPEPYIQIINESGGENYQSIAVMITKEDTERDNGDILHNFKQVLTNLSNEQQINLVPYPFLLEDTIGPVVAEEMRNSTIWALLISWIVIIIYVWIRFFSIKFGFAAVIALIHDALLSLAFVIFLGIVVPKAAGISFSITLPTVAALMTIIGYSVNDTIVIFDRIRENLRLFRKHSFADIVNMSVNQTLSRTITTSFATWLSVLCLLVFTIRSSGGIWELSLPLVFGLIVGAYSTIFVANPLIILFNKGNKPNVN